ncbi:MAG: hypothetical protein UR45_C0032G0005 [candidate division WS6 bacterium GW2011_WS6_33_547]|nr:MAG: hypothetical protein UR45_C0032G0005 [candidate division WS6 bacterium GW2011_WS6_33_547]
MEARPTTLLKISFESNPIPLIIFVASAFSFNKIPTKRCSGCISLLFKCSAIKDALRIDIRAFFDNLENMCFFTNFFIPYYIKKGGTKTPF